MGRLFGHDRDGRHWFRFGRIFEAGHSLRKRIFFSRSTGGVSISMRFEPRKIVITEDENSLWYPLRTVPRHEIKLYRQLEEKGILTREYTEENKRAYKIDITEKGKELGKFLHDKELEWEEEIAHELEMSRGELLTTLERLALKALEFDRQRIDNFKY